MEISKQLIKAIQQDKLVVFVGAGVSIKAGFPNWNELIEKILDGIKEKENKSEKFKNALRDDLLTPIEILTKIKAYKEEAIEILYNELNNYSNTEPLEIHSRIGMLADKIITTNYDGLLEKALTTHEKVSYTNDYKVAKLKNFKKYIFKIHGDIDEPDKCILFPDEYEKQYSSNEKSSLFELKKIISDKSILFIGFSLNDPYINYIFEHIYNIYSGFNPQHYIITTSKSLDFEYKVNPIVLNDYSEVDGLLDILINYKTDFEKESSSLKSEISQNEGVVLEVSPNLEFDSPPTNKFWVGRSKEIRNIGNENFKAIFITGIGGQGKSALASQYSQHHFDQKKYEFADWRDFKEETNRFQTKLMSIIQRLNPDFNINVGENCSNNDLVDIFFNYLNKRRIIFVFDNIDSYIDLVEFKPIGSFEYFFEQILKKDHDSKFIFTCRPFIREASINFYQISLSGLSLQDSEELFKKYKIPISAANLRVLTESAHELTKGHPLWLNLIAGQAVRGVDTVNTFIKSIKNKTDFGEEGFSAILSEKILHEVWNSLNHKQKVLIRGIAETVKPEKEEDLRSILSSELNTNQFEKSLRVLKNLNLVETLSDNEIELHPLVKEFILNKYPRTERSKFITLLVKYYDKFIYILKPRLNSNLTLSELQNWTLKVELQINNNDFKSALISLHEVCDGILTSGFSEEYLRVAELLFDKIDWKDAITNEYPYFDTEFASITTVQTQMGEFERAVGYLEKYKRLIPGRSSKYLIYCSQMTYLFWYQEEFDKGISIGEEGLYLLTESNLADNYSLKHNLSLSLRDSMNEQNISRALEYFLRNENLEKMLEKENINFDLQGHHYGNVGRCLEYLNRSDDALHCYLISLRILLKENDTNSILNIGYASYWISNILLSRKDFKNGLYFLKHAINCWKKTSTLRETQLKKTWSNIIFDKNTKIEINKLPNWKIESYCKQYILDKNII